MKIIWGRSIRFNVEFNTIKITSIITEGEDCYPWTETFVMWPRTTITGKKLFWKKAYKRKVWAVWGTGFHVESIIQYAGLFEILEEP